MAHRIHIIVVSVNDERTAYMKRMFEDIKLPYSYSIHRGITPADMRGFVINDIHPVFPEQPTVLCCTRSHISAIHEFATVWRDNDILIVMEDDVTMLRHTFESELNRVLALWDKHATEIDYVSLGYLANSDGSQHNYKQHDDCLRWDNMIRGGGHIWGAQAYMMRRPVAEQISRDLYTQHTTSDLRRTLVELQRTINGGLGYSYKSHRLQADAVFNVFLRQGFVYPMLVMESAHFTSTITGVGNDHRKQEIVFAAGGRHRDEFYAPSRIETRLV